MKHTALFAATAMAVSSQAVAADVVFADGKAHVPLPDTFVTSLQGQGVLATFGEGGSHRLEITLTGTLSASASSTAGIEFVADQAAKKGARLNRGKDRAVFM